MTVHERVATMGGADPNDPLDSNNVVRHTATGVLVIAIAIWAFAASLLAFHVNLKAPWYVAAPGAALIATIILGIDLLVTSTPLKEDTTAARARIVVLRGFVSLAMGLVISHASILFMYHDSLAQIVAERNQATAQAHTGTITDGSTYPAQIKTASDKTATDKAQITAQDNTLAAAQTELDKRKQDWLNDRVCIGNTGKAANGDACGEGDVADQLKQSYETYLNATLPAIQKTHDDTVTTLRADIAAQTKTAADAQDALNKQITDGTAADRANTGLVAQSDALWTLLKQDWFAWLWPVFFFIIDLVVALMKGILPESDFDRRRRQKRVREDDLEQKSKNNPVWDGVAAAHAEAEAEVATAQIKADAKEALARIEAKAQAKAAKRAKAARPKTVNLPRRRALQAGVTTLVIAALALTLTEVNHDSAPATTTMTASPGGTIQMHNGETLTIPPGAISGNEPVHASYTAAHAMDGSTPISDEVTFTTAGDVIGKPVLSMPVPADKLAAAKTGALHVAYRSSAPGGWSEYPSTFDPATNSLKVIMTHFSTWRFWQWDWASDLAQISQTMGEWMGRRSPDAPTCTNGIKPPSWYNADAGVTAEPAMVVRSCIQGHPGDDTLDVELVNNRPYGLELNYGGTGVKWGWHEDADSLADALRNAAGDSYAHASGGLYLPPLSRASVGIPNLGNGKNVVFAITPNAGTIIADLLDLAFDKIMGKVTDGVAGRWASDVFKGDVSKNCTKALVLGSKPSIPDKATIMNVLTSDVPDCLKSVLTVAARSEIAKGDGMNLAAIGQMSKGVSKLSQMSEVGAIADIENDLGNVLDYGVDQRYAAVEDLGFGFSILTHYTYEGPTTPPTTGSAPPTTGGSSAAPVLTINGSCTTASGTLTSSSSGFSEGGTYTVAVRRPDGSDYTGFVANGTVKAGGAASWTWSCVDDPAGTYTTQITDNSTGRRTGWVPFTIGAAPVQTPPSTTPPVQTPPSNTPPSSTPPTPPVNRTAVVSYDQMRGGAPYYGRSALGWQAFTAASNTITQIGVTWSNPADAHGQPVSGANTRISLCTGLGDTSSADPCVGRIGDTTAQVINQAETTGNFADIGVTPGATYYLFYYQPSFQAGQWDLYWWNCPACTARRSDPRLSDQNQAVVRGYNR